MKDTFNIYLKLLLRVSPLCQPLTTEASVRPDAQEHQRTEPFPPTQSERNRQGEIASSQPPAMCIFILSTPYHMTLKSRRAREASVRLCRWPFDALTTEFLKMSQNSLQFSIRCPRTNFGRPLNEDDGGTPDVLVET